LALAGMLGGIVIEAIVSLTLITAALAVFACALAMAISVRAKKTHEVLMGVYAIEACWILGPLIWLVLEEVGSVPGAPVWLWEINPFVMAWAPYHSPGDVSMWHLAANLGGLLGISTGLVAYTILKLRTEVATGNTRLKGSQRWLLGSLHQRV